MTVETSWPYGNASGISSVVSEEQWERLFGSNLLDLGVQDAPGGPSLRVFSQAVGGRQISVAPGPAVAVGHVYNLAAQLDISLAENVSGQLRYDRVVARLNPAGAFTPGTTPPVNDRFKVVVITGTPGAGLPDVATDPADVIDVRLAVVPVPSGALTIVPSTIVEDREFARTALIPCRNVNDVAQRRRQPGTVALEVASGRLHVYTGSAWQLVNPAGLGVTERFDGAPLTNAGAFDIAVTDPPGGTAFLVATVQIPARPYRRFLSARGSALMLAESITNAWLDCGFRLAKNGQQIAAQDRPRLIRVSPTAGVGGMAQLDAELGILDPDASYQLQWLASAANGTVSVTTDRRFTYCEATTRGAV